MSDYTDAVEAVRTACEKLLAVLDLEAENETLAVTFDLSAGDVGRLYNVVRKLDPEALSTSVRTYVLDQLANALNG